MITLNDAETVKEFGEPVEFYTWDRQPLETFMKIANNNGGESDKMLEVVKKLILDENGKEIITNDNMLPSKILVAVISKIVETLGK